MDTPEILKTGGDPRGLPDYAALRDELRKLSHPARPDVNWHYAEKLCHALFEQNGVELQTTSWYTLVRTQLGGISGLNEGLAILEALVSHQWGTIWPQPVHARMEIMGRLSQRLQQRLRTQAIIYSDLAELYLAEQHLSRLTDALQRLELRHLSQFDALRTLIHNAAVRLENSESVTDAMPSSPVALPAAATQPLSAEPASQTIKWIYVAQPKAESAPPVATASGWRPFVAGMAMMLAAGAAAVWGWHYQQRQDPLQAQLAATLSAQAAVLTSAQQDAVRQHHLLPESFIADTQQQLVRLSRLPPDWSIDYSRQLLAQAQALSPQQGKALAQRWQRQLSSAALPAENLSGWHQGMSQLQQLSNRLKGLDEQKGKYMTVSELKSVVFTAMQSFNQTIPAEERLRVLAETSAEQPPSAVALTQLEVQLQLLIAGYAQLKRPDVN